MPQPTYIATCPKGVEPLLADELRSLGADEVRETRAAVTFAGPLETAYRACLWSRLASRVMLSLAEFDAAGADALYEGVTSVAWEEHVPPGGTIAVDAAGSTSGLTNSVFAAQKAKDAIVDRMRDKTGERPSVDLADPDIRLNLRLARERAQLSLDLSGEPLHRRGYRTEGEQAAAPLKENLAAAVLVRAGWPAVFSQGGALADPMCGSGTLLIEGALMAGDRAPGLLRARWGFDSWLGHEAETWETLLDEADERAEAGADAIPPIAGADADPAAIDLATACARRAGVGGATRLAAGDVSDFEPPAGGKGLLVTNPPYGERLGEAARLRDLYGALGRVLVERFDGWTAAVLTSEEQLARATGLRSRKAYTLYNGAIPVRLYLFDVSRGSVRADVRRSD